MLKRLFKQIVNKIIKLMLSVKMNQTQKQKNSQPIRIKSIHNRRKEEQKIRNKKKE